LKGSSNRIKESSKLYAIARAGAAISAALFIVLFTAGCRYTAAPADLLQKPSIAADKTKLVNAIDNTLSKYSKLTLPLRESKEEAIRLVDVDGDGIAEAIVSFYNEYSTPQMLVFKEQNSVWKAWVLIEQPLAKQIEWLHTEDLNGDGYMELIVGWVGAFDSPNQLEVYSFQNKGVRNENGQVVLQPVETLLYSYADIGDISGEGRKTLAVITETGANMELAEKEYLLGLYEWVNGSMRKTAEISLDEGVNGYVRLVLGRISPRHYGIILEAQAGAHSMYTSMYKWENRRLQLVYPNRKYGEEGLTISSTRSEDVNGDGILELHHIIEPPGSEELPYSDTVYANQWLQWDGRETYTVIAEEYSDYVHGIRVSIPEQWFGKYALHYADDVERGLVVFEYWSESLRTAVPLATLYAVSQPDWDKVEADWRERGISYEVVLKEGGNIYAVSFQHEEPAGLSADELAQYKEMLQAKEHFKDYVSSFEIL